MAVAGATLLRILDQGAEPSRGNDGSALASGDWAQYERIILVSDGSNLRLVRLTIPQITALLPSLINQNISLITPEVLNAQQSLSSFTASVVLSDLPYNVYTTIKQITIPTGASYIEAYGQCAYRNDSTSQRISFTTQLTLTGTDASTQFAQYVGGAILPVTTGTAGTQSEQEVSFKFQNLNKTVTYTLYLQGQKIDNYSSLVVLDGYVRANYA